MKQWIYVLLCRKGGLSMSDNGLIHVYYGDGKGKTTAALGLAMRAAGCGKNVIVVQFLKSWKSGEHNSISHIPNIILLRGKPSCGKFIHEMNEEEKQKTKAQQDECLKNAIESIENGQCDMLILDEAIDAHRLGVLDAELLEGLLHSKPDMLEIVITGHKPDVWLLERADYITEMVKHKHPFDKGIKARQGIEF